MEKLEKQVHVHGEQKTVTSTRHYMRHSGRHLHCEKTYGVVLFSFNYSCCYDRTTRAASAQSFTLWQQATIEITRRDHSIIACLRHIYKGIILRAHPVRGESHIQRNANWEVATLSLTSSHSEYRTRSILVKRAWTSSRQKNKNGDVPQI